MQYEKTYDGTGYHFSNSTPNVINLNTSRAKYSLINVALKTDAFEKLLLNFRTINLSK